jgi:serine/threonine protein phosphatase PrpC/sugar lactone lactonase YvrE
MLATTYAGYSDVGRKRSRNDDRWAADPPQGLYIVADGVGSSKRGDLAAELVVELLPAYVARHLAGADLHDAEAPARFGQAVVQLSEDLYARSRSADSGFAGADTTVVAALVTDSRALIAHLGDSRAYLYRDRRVERLTSDHTIVQAVIDAGHLSAEEAAHHPNRSVLTRHVLMTPPARPDVSALDLQPGDRILLCSDGLHGLVDDAALAATLTVRPDPADACRTLIEAANQAGGPDNITAVVIDAGIVPPTPPTRPAPLYDAPPPPPPPPPTLESARQQPAEVGVAATQQPPTQPLRPSRRRGVKLGLIAAIVGIVVVLCAAGLTGYLLWPRSPASQTQTVQPKQPPAPPAQTVLPFAGLKPPDSMAVDRAGTVYIADTGNNRVLVLAAGAGTPTGLPFTDLKQPDGVAVDTAGTVYITDTGNNRVLKLAAGADTPTVLPFTGLSSPHKVAVDTAGTVYVVDLGHNRVVKLAADADAETEPLPFTGLSLPLSLAVDTAGNLYVTDNGNNRVLKLVAGADTPTVLPFAGLNSPHDVAVDTAGNLYVADFGNNRVLKLAAGSGTQTMLAFTGLTFPQGVAVDSAGGVYSTNTGNGQVVKLPAG